MSVQSRGKDNVSLLGIDTYGSSQNVLYDSAGNEITPAVPVAINVANVSTSNNDLIPAIDVTPYKVITLQLSGTWVGVVEFSQSLDNGEYYQVQVQKSDASRMLTTTENGLVRIPVMGSYLRVRATTVSSGTVEGSALGYKENKGFEQAAETILSAETDKVIGVVKLGAQSNAVNGTITAADTAVIAPTHDGTLLSGTPSVNSYVVIQSSGTESTWTAEITGTLGGTIVYFEGSAGSTDGIDGNWVALVGNQTGIGGNFLHHQTSAVGKFSGNISGLKYFRARAVGGVGINLVVDLRLAAGTRSVFLNESLPVGSNKIGSVEIAVSGTPSYHKFISATGLNPVSVKASAAKMTILYVVNGAATLRYFKLYDKASAPTVGTDVPLITITLPPTKDSSFKLPLSGIDFANGLAFACTLGVADSDTSPFTVTGEVTALIAYI